MSNKKEILVGCVVADKAPVVSVELDINDEVVHRARRAERFSLEVEGSGEQVVIEPATGVELLPRRGSHGRFGDLAGDPLGRVILDEDAAPGDHVEVSLAGNVVEAMEVVALYGAVRQSGEGGRILHAEVIAVGEGARELIEAWRETKEAAEAPTGNDAARLERWLQDRAQEDAKRQERQRARPDGGLSLGLAKWAAGLGAVALAFGLNRDGFTGAFSSLSRATPWLAGLSLVSAAVFLWRRRRWMPEFTRLKEKREGSGVCWSSAGWLTGHTVLLVLWLLLAWLAPGRESNDWWLVPTFSVGASGFGLVYLVVLLVTDQRSAMIAHSLLRAAPLGDKPPAGRFGWIEGISSGGISRTRNFQVTRSRTRQEHRAADGTIQIREETSWATTWTEYSVADSYGLVETKHGPISVELPGATWSSACLSIARDPGGRGDSLYNTPLGWATRRAAGSLSVYTNPGDPILAAGRAHYSGDKLSFRVTGRESVLLFSSPPGTSPRKVLMLAVRDHYLGLAALAAISVLGIWLSFTRIFP